MKKFLSQMAAAIVLIFMLAVSVCFAGQIMDHSSVLSGAVMSQGLVNVGQTVRQGDVLVMVDTIAGPAPASRYNVNGKVTEVLVKSGDIIRVGQIVARVEAQ